MSLFSTLRPLTNQTVAVGAASAQSTAFGSYTTEIRVVSTTACHLKLDINPTATSSELLLPANTVEYFHVAPGQKLAVIQNAAGGTLHITEMTR